MHASPAEPELHALLIGDVGARAFERVDDGRAWVPRVVPDVVAARELLASGLTGAALVLAPTAALPTHELLETARAVAEGSPELALGYVCGREPEQVERMAARVGRGAARVSGPPTIRVFNQLVARHPVRAAGLFDGREHARSPDEALALLQAPSDLDIFIGHSNGIDMSVGDVLLCRHAVFEGAPEHELRTMPCFHGGGCSRRIGSSAVPMAIDRVGARRIISASCWGAWLDGEAFVGAHGLADGLLHGAGVDVLLACLRVVSHETPELRLLYYLAGAGVPMGRIANLANCFRLASKHEAEWVCFGDPLDALPRIVDPIQADVDDARITVWVPEGAHAGPRDVVAVLPRSVLPPQPILLEEGYGRTLGASIDPHGGRVFATVPAGFVGPLRFDVLDRSVVTAMSETTRLLEPLAFLEAYALGPLGERAPDEARALLGAMSALKRALLGWPLDELAVGSVITHALLAGLELHLHGLLGELHRAVLELATRSMELLGYIQVDCWTWAYAAESLGSTTLDCAYCSLHVHESRLWSREGRMRTAGICDGCGCVYDGDVEVVRWLEVLGSPRAGQPLAVRLHVHNPFASPMPIAAAVVYDLHKQRQSRTTRSEVHEVDPGGVLALDVLVEIPGTVHSGTYNLGAVVIVGTKVNFVQRHVHVKGHHLPVVSPE